MSYLVNPYPKIISREEWVACRSLYDRRMKKYPIMSTPTNRAQRRYSAIKNKSLKKYIPFNLDVRTVQYLIESPCHYCGKVPISVPGSHFGPTSEIDRKVPSLGYMAFNCVPACRRCNTLKSNCITYEEMLKVVEVCGWRKT